MSAIWAVRFTLSVIYVFACLKRWQGRVWGKAK